MTRVAGWKLAFPGWSAAIEQRPVAAKMAVLPVTVQMLGVIDVKLTGRPELAVARKVIVEVTGWSEIELKLMLCSWASNQFRARTPVAPDLPSMAMR